MTGKKQKPENNKKNTIIILIAAALLLLSGGTWLGLGLRKQSLLNNIERYLDRAQEFPNDEENYKKISSLYEKLGDPEKADAFYRLYRQALENQKNPSQSMDLEKLRELLESQQRQKEKENEMSQEDKIREYLPQKDLPDPRNAEEERAQKYYKQALDAFNKTDYDKAKDFLTRAIKVQPEMAAAHSLKSRTHLEQDELEDAVFHANKTLKLDKNDPEPNYVLGEVAMANKDTDTADQNFRSATIKDPEHYLSYYRLAAIRYRQKLFPEAAELYQKVISIKSDFYKAYVNLGLTLIQVKQNKDAEKVFLKALSLKDIKNQPSDLASVYRSLGLAYRLQRKNSEAIDAYEKAIATESKASDYFSLASLYEQENQNEKAKSSYTRGLATHGNHFPSLYNLGNLYFQEGDDKNAKKYYLKALDENDKHISTLIQLGKLEMRGGSRSQAKKYFDQVLAEEPNNPTANSELAKYWRQLNLMEQSVKHAVKAVQNANSKEEEVIFNNELGLTYNHFGQHNEAIASFQKARSHDPANVEVMANLADALTKANEIDLAIEVYSALIRLRPQNGQYYEFMANLQIKSGNQPEAKVTLEKLFKNASDYPQMDRAKATYNSL